MRDFKPFPNVSEVIERFHESSGGFRVVTGDLSRTPETFKGTSEKFRRSFKAF